MIAIVMPTTLHFDEKYRFQGYGAGYLGGVILDTRWHVCALSSAPDAPSGGVNGVVQATYASSLSEVNICIFYHCNSAVLVRIG